jgi:hypothetical protein
LRNGLLLAALAMVATFVFVSMALAQAEETTMMEPTMPTGYGGQYVYGGTGGETTAYYAGGGGGIPPTGGPAIVLPAASLLLGSGILTYAILTRR